MRKFHNLITCFRVDKFCIEVEELRINYWTIVLEITAENAIKCNTFLIISCEFLPISIYQITFIIPMWIIS